MEKKQSSVEWLFNEIAMPEYGEPPKWVMDILQQAREMFQGEIETAYSEGCEIGEMFNNESRCFKTDAEKYYNETFKV